MTSRCRSHNGVEPSTSVIKNVKTPVGCETPPESTKSRVGPFRPRDSTQPSRHADVQPTVAKANADAVNDGTNETHPNVKARTGAQNVHREPHRTARRCPPNRRSVASTHRLIST